MTSSRPTSYNLLDCPLLTLMMKVFFLFKLLYIPRKNDMAALRNARVSYRHVRGLTGVAKHSYEQYGTGYSHRDTSTIPFIRTLHLTFNISVSTIAFSYSHFYTTFIDHLPFSPLLSSLSIFALPALCSILLSLLPYTHRFLTYLWPGVC